VLTRAHESFYAGEVAGIASSRLLIQPSNRGTAPAILFSLLRLREMDPKGIVAIFPSDHHFSDDEAFISHTNSAYAAAALRPEMVILMGIPPEAPEVQYGWIEPGIPLGRPVPDRVCRVSRFWEKPNATLASALMERGCLWNSFVMVGHIEAFLELTRRALPDLVRSFESIRTALFTTSERMALRELYSSISATSFSHDVLSVQADDLAVLRATGLGWSDLGEPSRVRSVLERQRVQKEHRFSSDGGDTDEVLASNEAFAVPERIWRSSKNAREPQSAGGGHDSVGFH
jgi:mannose-1-phosphate guanylyltransferase